MKTHPPTTPNAGTSKPTRSIRSIAILCLTLAGSALYADGNTSSVTFKDPAKPGKLHVYVASGDIHIRVGTEAGVIRVESDAKQDEKEQKRSDGLRVLSTPAASFSLTVNENNAELSYGKDGWSNRRSSADFNVVVPANTSIDIENSLGGDIIVEKVSGDVVVKGLNSDIKLTDLEGGASVETTSGEITASFAKIASDRPLSFSSMNGEIKLSVPADTKANVRFRSHNGTILTDFPEDVLKAVAENLGTTKWSEVAGQHVRIAGQVASEIGRQIAEISREVAQEVRAAHEEARAAKKEAEQIEKESGAVKIENKSDDKEPKAEQTKEKSSGKNYGTARIRAPKPPRPPSIPAISGGKLVTGSINGGGPEILVTTMNGDITLRRK